MDPASSDPPAMYPALLQPLEDAVALFDALQIPYALVGGIAAMVYGRARFTEDVDFVASASHEQVLAAHPDVMASFHFDPACTWKLYHITGIEIDIWKDDYSDQIAARAQVIQLRGHAVRIAEIHDLIAMKLRANRPQDDYDISEILKHTAIDETLLQQRIAPEQFARFLAIKGRILK